MAISKEEIFALLGVNGEYRMIDSVPFYIVDDADWAAVSGGKLQPTQSCPTGMQSFVMAKKSYYDNDKYFWLEHEKNHCLYYFAHPEVCKEYLPYPDNPVERFAFAGQFGKMKQAGLNKDECFALIKQAYTDSQDWEQLPDLEKFLKQQLDDIFIE